MTLTVLAWLAAIPMLGFATGLRTMTPMAVVCWFAYLHHLPIRHSWAFWAANIISAIVFTVLALGEYIGDKLPQTPNRTAPGPLVARLVFAGLVGAIVATGLKGSAVEGIILAALGALVGAFGGYLIRRDLVQWLQCKDWYVAVVEDLVAVTLAVVAMGIVAG
jgi:uncharacterized membrane protein